MFGFANEIRDHFVWNRFLFVQSWILVLFLIYVTASTLSTLFGQGEIARILFRRRSTELQLQRRRRVRALTELGRLAAEAGPAALRDPTSAANRRLFELLAALGPDRPAAPPRG
jgi:hypothetical protein